MSEQKEKLPFHVVILEAIGKKVNNSEVFRYYELMTVQTLGEVLRDSKLPTEIVVSIVERIESFADNLENRTGSEYLRELGQDLSHQLMIQKTISLETNMQLLKSFDEVFSNIKNFVTDLILKKEELINENSNLQEENVELKKNKDLSSSLLEESEKQILFLKELLGKNGIAYSSD